MNNFQIQQQFWIGDYYIDFHSCVARGQFCNVFLCTRIHNHYEEECIVKIMIKPLANDKIEKRIKKELEVLKIIKQNPSEYLIKIYDIFETDIAYFVMMEIYDETLEMSFIRLLRQGQWYNQSQQIQIIQDIIKCFRALYDLNIIHKQLEARTILVRKEKSIYRISGFSHCELCDDMEKKKVRVKFNKSLYSIPQTLFFENQYSGKCDIYSLGIIFYQIIFQNQFPFQGSIKSRTDFYKKLEKQPFKCMTPEGEHSLLLCQLLEKMIVYSENDRMSYAELFQNKIFEINQQNLKEQQ